MVRIDAARGHGAGCLYAWAMLVRLRLKSWPDHFAAGPLGKYSTQPEKKKRVVILSNYSHSRKENKSQEI